MNRRARRLGLDVFLVATVVVGASWSQETPAPQEVPPAETQEDASATEETPLPARVELTGPMADRRESLVELLAARDRVRADLARLRDELRSEEALGRQEEIEAEIRAKSSELESLERDFRGISSRVELSVFEEGDAERVTLTEELRDLIDPIIGELKQATSRPREINRLELSIKEAKERQSSIGKALSEIDTLLDAVEDEQLRTKLEEERGYWIAKQRDTRTEISIAQQMLDQRLAAQVSPAEAISEFVDGVLRKRGMMLFVALASALAFLFILSRLHQLVTRKRKPGQRQRLRIVNVLYLLGRLVGAVAVFLLVLYLFGDWALLVLVILLLLGIFWGSKDAVPKFWTQAVLLLDAGPVREHERVLHGGLPWRVGTINFYTQLVNPSLAGGRIRLPINDLSELRSRKAGAEEPWFPTEKDQWVIVNDAFGEVVLQSPEQVHLRELGGAMHVIPTLDFVAAAPLVLSHGFRLRCRVEIDYAYRPIAPLEVPGKIRAYTEENLAASEYAERVVKIGAEYESAGASSLVTLLQVDFDGEAAPRYKVLERLLARLALEVCNENEWEIPFTQITVHQAGGGR